ncbi:sulfurtransferase-like selenium metabolism protein YedF [Anaerococcus sp. AGMB00486]|uniref:Sulfurtransferase-like selenium metabolism protein YedF n=1 Tax=Anaerococcus faecalis TaxID=2742993 RepID=A0ABX2NCG1_9FIRM|nr:sulfurtransferase-like selenium metabolism protein YedF [Anaerococcus faecalis]NVF12328.1 sulfurtransferase-like selenium metabolism protein YedF [Anaerococcus faecalis]
MKEIDARGIECPMPVIMAKRVIKSGEESFKVLVNEDIAVENLKKLARQTGFEVELKELENKDVELTFNKLDEFKDEKLSKDSLSSSYVVVFDSDRIGDGDEEFSKSLLESFLVSLTEEDVLPDYVICYNKGVFLTTQRENTIEDFKKLEKNGVEIISCGLCLDHYGLKEDLKVGRISNMYEICSLMRIHHTVRP